MSRAQVVGFASIAVVAVVIALWLAVAPPPPPNAAARASRTAAPTLTPTLMTAPLPATSTKRPTRAAPATQLRQRLELVGKALDDAAKKEAERAEPQTETAAETTATARATTATATKPAPGALTKQQVQQGVQAVQPQIVDCYEQALAQNPELSGTLQVLFEIGADPDDDSKGAVVAGEVDSAMGSPFFEACVLQSIVGARFPRPAGGVVKVTYPFTFEASDDDADAGP